MDPLALPESLRVGLKEWACVCLALERSRQMVLLRKGGIHEAAGEFELEHPSFVLFPTYLHQRREMLKPEAHGDVVPRTAEPERITISAAASVTSILPLESRRQMDRIEDQHIWAPPLIDMRFGYRPENPLYLLIVRTWLLPRPVTVDNTPAYAGCKSWVPLDEPIDTRGARPAIDDAAFEQRRAAILARLGAD